MAELSKVNVNATDYDLKDQKSRDALVDVVNNGAKNKLKNTAISTTVGEAVFTVNDDGTVTAYTTTTTAASRSLQIASSGYVDSTDICTGTPDVVYDVNTQFGIGDSGNIKNIAPGEAVTAGVSGNIRYFSIYIRAGVNIPQSNAITFRPMVCSKAEWDISHAYVPYGKTNHELTVENDSQQSEIDYAVNVGAKNILTPTLTSESTKEGITCTPNPDGTFTLNGTFPTTSSETNTYFVVVNNAKLKELSDKYGAVDVICSGGSDIGRSQGRLRFYKIDTNENTYDSSATDKEMSLTLSDNISSFANISIVVYRGQTLNNVVIKPMIRPAAIIDPTYEPYAPTNRELYEEKIEIEDVYGAGTKIDANTNLNDIKTHGLYYSASVQDIASFTNCPVSAQFTLSVKFGSQSVFQEIQPMSKAEIMYRYVRMFTNGIWSSWYKFEGTEVT